MSYNEGMPSGRPVPGSPPDPFLSPSDPRALVRRLAEERARRGLSQAEVARQMDVSAPYIAKFEKALSDPRFSTLMRYASIVLGAVALAALLNELAKLASPQGRPGAQPPG